MKQNWSSSLLELHMKYLHSPTANRDGDKISNHDDDPEEMHQPGGEDLKGPKNYPIIEVHAQDEDKRLQ